jgi:hypothetical protein
MQGRRGDDDAVVEWSLGSLRMETRAVRRFGRFWGPHESFRFYPDAHVYLNLGTGQEKKLGPDEDE